MNFTKAGLVAALAIAAGCTKAPPPPPPPPSVAMVPAAEKSASFDVVNQHLELGGTLYGYMDIAGDTAKLSAIGQRLVEQIATVDPDLKPARPLDFKALFQSLGINDLDAFGMSSVQEPDGEFRNRAFFYTPRGRRGLLRLLGDAPEPSHFEKLAPADVDCFEEIQLDFPTVCSAVKQVLIAAQGAEAEKKTEDQLSNPAQTGGINVISLLKSLHGHLVLMIQTEPDKTITIPGVVPVSIPRFSMLIGLENAAPALQGWLDQSPFLQGKADGGRKYYTPRMPMAIDGIRPVVAVDGKNLWVSTSEFFLHRVLEGGPGGSLAQTPDYQRLEKEFSGDANVRAYVSPRLNAFVVALVKAIQKAHPNGVQAMQMQNILGMLPASDHAQMLVVQNQPDGISFRSRSSQSLKQAVFMPFVYNVVALGVLAAQPAFKAAAAKSATGGTAGAVPQLTPDQKVQRNLRILYVVGNAYFRRTNKTEASFDELIGPGKMLPRLVPAEGESYDGLKVEKGQPIKVTLPDGRQLQYPPK